VSTALAQAATMTTSNFVGTILAGAAITMTGLAVAPTTTSFNGDALAKAAVTLTNVVVTGCDICFVVSAGAGDWNCPLASLEPTSVSE